MRRDVDGRYRGRRSLQQSEMARIEVEKDRWPKTCAWVDRTQATPALAKVTRLGEMLVQTPPGSHHAALANLGVPLTDTTLATVTPRRGPMSLE